MRLQRQQVVRYRHFLYIIYRTNQVHGSEHTENKENLHPTPLPLPATRTRSIVRSTRLIAIASVSPLGDTNAFAISRAIRRSIDRKNAFLDEAKGLGQGFKDLVKIEGNTSKYSYISFYDITS